MEQATPGQPSAVTTTPETVSQAERRFCKLSGKIYARLKRFSGLAGPPHATAIGSHRRFPLRLLIVVTGLAGAGGLGWALMLITSPR